MTGFVHTPYGGTYKPFTIGMNLLNPREWIEADRHLADYLAEKDRLIAADREAVFREETETRAAQSEVLDLLAAHLPERFPDTYRRDGGRIEILPAGRTIDVGDEGDPPLLRAARLVQEDLVLMRRGEGGWRMAAACVCFPSSWALADKFGRTLDGLHAPVPGYADLMAGRVARIFDHLRVENPVWRMGWSFHAAGDLHHPFHSEWPAEGAGAFIRLERQTLCKLPASGDVLFTIRIHVDPLDMLKDHPDGVRLAAGMKAELEGLGEAQLAYRSLEKIKSKLIALLDGLIGE